MPHQMFPYMEEVLPRDAAEPHGEVVPLAVGSTVHDVERELVLQTLSLCNGNRTHAARMLGVSVRTLRNRIRLYTARGIDVPAHH